MTRNIQLTHNKAGQRLLLFSRRALLSGISFPSKRERKLNTSTPRSSTERASCALIKCEFVKLKDRETIPLHPPLGVCCALNVGRSCDNRDMSSVCQVVIRGAFIASLTLQMSRALKY
jgi:hypothetical protein